MKLKKVQNVYMSLMRTHLRAYTHARMHAHTHTHMHMHTDTHARMPASSCRPQALAGPHISSAAARLCAMRGGCMRYGLAARRLLAVGAGPQKVRSSALRSEIISTVNFVCIYGCYLIITWGFTTLTKLRTSTHLTSVFTH